MTSVIASVAAFYKLFRPFLLILKRRGRTFNPMVFTVSLVFSHSSKSIFWIRFLEICNMSTQNHCKAFSRLRGRKTSFFQTMFKILGNSQFIVKLKQFLQVNQTLGSQSQSREMKKDSRVEISLYSGGHCRDIIC